MRVWRMVALLSSFWLWGQDSLFWPGRFLFELVPNYTLNNLPSELKELQAHLGVISLRERFAGLKMTSPVYVAEYRAVVPPLYAAKLWARSPAVRYAEPEPIPTPLADPQRLLYTPNDPLLDQCPSLTHLRVLQAWDSTQGDTSFVWAVVDTDVQFDHPDLIDNIAYNWDDPINGVDDDGDGYVDNFHGWDMVGAMQGDGGDNDPRAPNSGHGTWAAGFGGATTNNDLGIAAPAFKCRLLPIKAAPDNSWALFGAYDGLLYAARKGARVLNASWGTPIHSRAAQNFITSLINTHDVLIVAAAGNIPPPIGTRFYPAMYEGVLSVTAVEDNDLWPNRPQAYYGIDVCATGRGTTLHGLNGYISHGFATSFAAPQASGCAILLRSWRPNLNARQITELLRITGDSVDHLNPNLRYQLGRRINLYRAILTQDTPACRISTCHFRDSDGDSLFYAGEIVYITPTYINYLSPVQNLSITLSSLSPHIEIIDGVYAAGNLGTLETHQQARPFRVRVSPDAPVDATAVLIFHYSGDGDYRDYETLELSGLNPPYLHLTAAKLKTTISAHGRIGYHDPPRNTIGLGVTWGHHTTSWLYEGGLVLADNTAHTCTRGPSGNWYQHFLPTSTPQRTYTSLYEIGHLEMHGNAAQDPAALPFSIRLQTYGIRYEPANPFLAFVYELENLSNQDYSNIALGWWLDWDVADNPSTDLAGADIARRLVYATNGTTRYAGALLLSPHTPVLHVGRVDTFQPTLPRYHAIFQGIGAPATTALGDIFTAIGARGISLPAGGKDTIALALVAGESWAELLNNARAAQTWYRCFLQGWNNLIDLGPDRALCLGDSLSAAHSGLTDFYWNTGARTSAIYPTQSGTYRVLARDASGCWSHDEVVLTVNTLLPADVQFSPGLSVTVGEPLTGTDNGPLYTRLWRVRTPTGWVEYAGPTFSHTFATSGTFEVRLLRHDSATDCRDSLSWQINVGTSSIAPPSATLSLYPNPTRGPVVIEGPVPPDALLSVSDLTGRLLWEVPLSPDVPNLTLPSSLAQGTYLWQIRSSGETRILAQGLLLYMP